MQRLADRLIDGVDVEPQHGAQSGRHRRAEVRDVVDLVLVQADPLDQVDLDLVRRRQTANQVVAAHTELLGNRDQRRDVVAGVGVLGGQEGVVVVEFTHCDAVGPGRPLGRVAAVDTEHRRARTGPVRKGLVRGRW